MSNKNFDLKFAFDMGGLGKWKDESSELITNLVAGGELFNDWNFIEGNTYKKPINVLDTTVSLQKGDCVTTPGGTVSFIQRDINVDLFTERKELCIDKLKPYWTGMKYQGKGANYDELEFESIIVEDLVSKIAKQKEVLSFVGNASNPNEMDGLLTIADTETGSLNSYGTFSGITALNAVATVDAEIAKHINNADIASAPTVMYMSYSDAFLLSSALIKDYGDFLNREKDFMAGELIRFAYPKLPSVTIIGTHALQGNGSIFTTNVSNLNHSGDLIGDSDEIYTEASKFHQKYLMLVKFYFGVNYTFPENVTYLKKLGA